MRDLPKRADVVVIGAGIIGLSVAFQLKRRGVDVLLLERDNGRTSASYAAAGIILPTCISRSSETLREFVELSHGAYPKFLREIERAFGMECRLNESGGLFVARTQSEQDELEERQALIATRGIRGRLMPPARIVELEPALSHNIRCGMLIEKEYWVSPQRILAALTLGFQSIGGRIVYGAAVKKVADCGEVSGSTCPYPGTKEEFTVRGGSVVVAAGSSSCSVVGSIDGLNCIQPMRGELVVLKGAPLIRRPIHLSDGYAVRRSRSCMVIGSVDRVGVVNTTPDALGASQLRHALGNTLPVLGRLRIRDVIVGIRTRSPDKAPCLGHIRDSLFIATSHYRNGIMLAAGTAGIMADLLCSDKQHALLKSLRPSRFS